MLWQIAVDGTRIRWTVYRQSSADPVISPSSMGIAYRLTVVLPTVADFRLTPKRQVRSQSGIESEHAKETRRRFRALGLYLKAILEATEDGIIDARTALVGHKLLPSGEAVAEYADIEIGRALAAGEASRLTPALNPPESRRELTDGNQS